MKYSCNGHYSHDKVNPLSILRFHISGHKKVLDLKLFKYKAKWTAAHDILSVGKNKGKMHQDCTACRSTFKNQYNALLWLIVMTISLIVYEFGPTPFLTLLLWWGLHASGFEQHFNRVDLAIATPWFLSFSAIVGLLLCLGSLYCCVTRFGPSFICQRDGLTFGSTRFKECCSQVQRTVASRLLTMYLLNIVLTHLNAADQQSGKSGI